MFLLNGAPYEEWKRSLAFSIYMDEVGPPQSGRGLEQGNITARVPNRVCWNEVTNTIV